MKRDDAELIGGNMGRTKALFEYFDAAKRLAASLARRLKGRRLCLFCGASVGQPHEKQCELRSYEEAFERAKEEACRKD